jgi:hypothetical protein
VLEAHDPQLGWPPETWRLLYLSVLLAAQGPSRRLDQVLEQLQGRAVHDPRPPWLAEHVTDMRQRAMTAAGDAARAGQPPNTTRSLTARLAKYRG